MVLCVDLIFRQEVIQQQKHIIDTLLTSSFPGLQFLLEGIYFVRLKEDVSKEVVRIAKGYVFLTGFVTFVFFGFPRNPRGLSDTLSWTIRVCRPQVENPWFRGPCYPDPDPDPETLTSIFKQCKFGITSPSSDNVPLP